MLSATPSRRWSRAEFTGPKIKTHGPEGRFSGFLYIEKEGFEPLLSHARIAERFDLAIMSCKGMSVTAARELVDQTWARYRARCTSCTTST